jgi:glycosyltransferase involved in cell wall biosynthesis
MTLVINGRFKTHPVSGVERYAHEVTRRLRGEVRFEIPPRKNGAFGHWWEQFILPRCVRSGEWLFSPANTGPVAVRNQIVTIHDLSPLEHPEWFARGFAWWYRLLWPVLVRRVRGILTDSAFSRQRIMALLQVPPAKIVALPNGVDTQVFYPRSPREGATVRGQYQLEKEYLLFVGSWQPRKNLSGLLDVWQQIQGDFSAIDLVFAGRRGKQFSASHYKAGVARFLENVSDEHLPALYSGAIGLVHPGLYEGSGLTLLEAMASGCPVVVANNTALPEVAGDAGLFFDPYDQENMAKTLRIFLSDEDLRVRLRAKGAERVRSHPWERTCDEFHEALHHFQVW